jgi:transposase
MLINNHLEILLCKKPCDMRKSINGLSQLIASEFGYNPSDGRLYIFINKECNKLKILYWDKNGFCLWYKRLEKANFKLPAIGDAKVLPLEYEQLQWLLSGLDMGKVKGFERLKYEHFY